MPLINDLHKYLPDVLNKFQESLSLKTDIHLLHLLDELDKEEPGFSTMMYIDDIRKDMVILGCTKDIYFSEELQAYLKRSIKKIALQVAADRWRKMIKPN